MFIGRILYQHPRKWDYLRQKASAISLDWRSVTTIACVRFFIHTAITVTQTRGYRAGMLQRAIERRRVDALTCICHRKQRTEADHNDRPQG